MRLNIEIDDELLARAQSLSGLESAEDVINAGLSALVLRESVRRRAQLSARQPGAPRQAPQKSARGANKA